MAHILVTGAAGFIGSHTCDLLLAEGHTVTGIDNFRTGRRENLEPASRSSQFRLLEGDVTDAAWFQAACAAAKPDGLIHLAALVSVPESIKDPELNFRLNIVATQNIIAAAIAAGVKRVVFASSAAVYGEATDLPLTEDAATVAVSPYGGAKLASEALLLSHAAAFGFVARCMRYFNVFGPRQDPRSPYSGVISIFSERLVAGKPVTVFGDGEQTRDFISVHDVARANMIAATARDVASGIANICTGRPTSLNQLLAALRSHVSANAAVSYGSPRAGDIRHSLGSPERAKRELGFEAKWSFEQGIEELVREEKTVESRNQT